MTIRVIPNSTQRIQGVTTDMDEALIGAEMGARFTDEFTGLIYEKRFNENVGGSSWQLTVESIIAQQLREEIIWNNPRPRIFGTTTQKVASITVPVLLVPRNDRRRAVTLTNLTGAQDVFLGFNSLLSATNGDLLLATKGSSRSYFTPDEIWGISLVAAQTLTISEESYADAYVDPNLLAVAGIVSV